MSDAWIELHEFVERWGSEKIEGEADPLTHALIERDRERIVEFIETTMLRQMSRTSTGEWLQ